MKTWSAVPNKELTDDGPLCAQLRAAGAQTLRQAARYVCELPYGRTSDRSDYQLVLAERRGTCSTKHALLADVASECGVELHLTLGIYEMCEANTPGVGEVLREHGLTVIPEAHTYLQHESKRIDITRSSVAPAAAIESFLHEEIIRPDQIGDYKASMHRNFLHRWVEQKKAPQGMTKETLWRIREACIAALTAAE